MKKLLIAYFSWSNGNTERIAKLLQKEVGGDLVKIETVQPYDASYDEVVKQAQEEVNRGYEPELKKLDINIDDYDVIAIGTPTWWYTMAPAVLTFMRQNNFKGKTVIPFMTNAGWPGHVINDMKKASGSATISNEKEILFDSDGCDHMETSQSELEEWIKEVKKTLANE